MKKFIVNKEFWDLFPDSAIGILVLENVKENIEIGESEALEIKNILDSANKEAKKYLTSDVISENEVVKVWREAYQKFPTKKGVRCSLENLLKRILHDNPVGTIFPSVDITNAISLKYALPIGAEDRDKLDGDIHLGAMKGGEKFLPIGSDKEEPPYEGEIAYYDNYGAVCRCLNWRDGKRTQIDDNTTSEFIVMECVDSSRIEDLNKAISELEELMIKYLGAKTFNKQIITKDNPSMDIE
ncbi:MAG: hypothetical protein IKG27_02555 [Bacilli bacterium]|nr:hypothetical protein [Bacilli bacterium]